MVRLQGIRACVFDAYGTLFDVHAPMRRLSAEIGEKADEISKLWRQKQLEYSWLRSLMGVHADFWHVTGDALDYALDAHGVSEPGLKDEIMALYLKLDAYPEAAAALQEMQDGFDDAVDAFGLKPLLDLEVRRLSAGQRRRVALGRLVGSPRALWLLGCAIAAMAALLTLTAPDQALILAGLFLALLIAAPLGWWLLRRRAAPLGWFARGFPWIFHLTAATFGLVHLGNYPEFSLLAVPLVLPQLWAGLVLGHIRQKIGLIGGILAHMTANGCTLGLALLAGG